MMRQTFRCQNTLMKMDDDGDGDFESTPGMVDTCHGDSGGPLACQVPPQLQYHQNWGNLLCLHHHNSWHHHDWPLIIVSIAIIYIIYIYTFSYKFLLQTGDGSYKLVGIVNWGGGYCGEVFESFIFYLFPSGGYCGEVFLSYLQIHFWLSLSLQAGKPGVYTRVQYYNEWIQEMMGGGRAANVLVAWISMQ